MIWAVLRNRSSSGGKPQGVLDADLIGTALIANLSRRATQGELIEAMDEGLLPIWGCISLALEALEPLFQGQDHPMGLV